MFALREIPLPQIQLHTFSHSKTKSSMKAPVCGHKSSGKKLHHECTRNIPRFPPIRKLYAYIKNGTYFERGFFYWINKYIPLGGNAKSIVRSQHVSHASFINSITFIFLVCFLVSMMFLRSIFVKLRTILFCFLSRYLG